MAHQTESCKIVRVNELEDILFNIHASDSTIIYGALRTPIHSANSCYIVRHDDDRINFYGMDSTYNLAPRLGRHIFWTTGIIRYDKIEQARRNL
jgi:hypothetical protein